FAGGRGRPKARLVPAPGPAFLNLGDPTFPDLVEGQKGQVWGAVVVVNATEKWTEGLRIKAKVGTIEGSESSLPPIPPLTLRKVPFLIEAPEGLRAGEVPLSLTLASTDKMLDFQKASLRVRTPKQTRKVTFFSQIDESVQYYAVN